MTRRRAPRDRFQQLQDGIVEQRVGGASRVFNASPVPSQSSAVARALASVAAISERSSKIDQFTLASGGVQDLTLSYLPIADSWNVDLNGVAALSGTDYSISGQTLSLLSSLDARTADKVQIQYDYLTGIPAAAQDLGEVLFTWNFNEAPSSSSAGTSGAAPWTTANGSFYNTTVPRHGTGSAIGWQSDCHAIKTFGSDYPTLACGLAVRSPASSTPTRWQVNDTDGDDYGLMSFCGDSGSTCHIYLESHSDSKIYVYRGQRGTLLATATAPFNTGTVGLYQYLIAQVTVHDTAGRVQVWIDGSLVVDFTGDTKNGGTSGLDTVKLGGYFPDNLITDDLYIATASIGDPGDVSLL